MDVGRNPKYNLISFDNIFSAMVMLFGADPRVADVQLLGGPSEAVFIYYLWIVFIGSFVVMQLLGAIILPRLQLAVRDEPMDAYDGFRLLRRRRRGGGGG